MVAFVTCMGQQLIYKLGGSLVVKNGYKSSYDNVLIWCYSNARIEITKITLLNHPIGLSILGCRCFNVELLVNKVIVTI